MHLLELEGKTVKMVKKRNAGLPDEGVDIIFEDDTVVMITSPGTILFDSKTKSP